MGVFRGIWRGEGGQGFWAKNFFSNQNKLLIWVHPEYLVKIILLAKELVKGGLWEGGWGQGLGGGGQSTAFWILVRLIQYQYAKFLAKKSISRTI